MLHAVDLQKLVNENNAHKFGLEANALADIIEAHKFLMASTQPLMADLLMTSRAMREIANGDWSIRLNEALSAAKILHRDSALISERVNELCRQFNSWHELSSITASVHSTAALISSLMRQDMLTNIYAESIKWAELPQYMSAVGAELIRIQDTFLPSVSAFSAVRDDFLQNKKWFGDFRIPFREHFLTTDLLRTWTSSEEADEFTEERTIIIKEADEQLMVTLPEALSELNPALYKMWQGAWNALTSENPDKIRHVSISIRELITHVLHELSPDEKMRKWSQSEEHYKNGKPTRTARLCFIYNDINDPTMKDYLKKEISACLSFIELANAGTHGVASKLNDHQLKLMLRRTHFMICTLVEIHKAKAQ